jgi:MinD-like ATPase involved in chromosome partitioning or flagellar assembly
MIHFREVRTAAVELLRTRAGEGQPIERALIIDDIFGKVRVLAWFALSAPPTIADDLKALMNQELGAYWADLWVASGASEADCKIYEELWKASNERAPAVRLSERTRSLGFWMKPPSEPAWQVGQDHPPVIAFYSFKGGVGRTTALASFAIQRARTGEAVVIVDLDLDAPGVGTLLGPGRPDAAQHLGVVDYLIESPLYPEISLSDYYHLCLDVQASPPGVSIAGSGQIFVFPAGSLDSDYLAMLSRLDLEPGSDEPKHPLLRLLDHARKELRPDWILLDCRAGLSESSGFALSGLANLTVLLGTTSAQSWNGLRLVIERLGAERVGRGLPQVECLVVQTMTPENRQTADLAESSFRADAEDIFKEAYYAEDPTDEDDDKFWYVRDMESEDSPHQPSVLYYSQRLAFIRSIEDVAETLAEDPGYSKLARRIASRFGKEPE